MAFLRTPYVLRTLSVLWLCASASAQGYGSTEVAIPEPTCMDGGVEYISHIGTSALGDCKASSLVDLSGVTSDECGRACAADPDCWCASHDRGECSLLTKDCCMADVLTPCRTGVQEESSGFEYVVGGLVGRAKTTRYWDCAKPACAWPGSNPVIAPVRSCRRDGYTTASPSESSGAGGGSAYACTSQQPWTSRYDANLAFAYVAFTAPSGGPPRVCCTCMELTFDDARLAGKRLVVQVINANGADSVAPAGQHFDIAVPGGGIGAANGCKSQWNAGASWGQLYGGLGPNRIECEGLPEPLRRGCRWQYDWLLDVRSDVTYREIACPGALIRSSRCVRR